MKIVESFRRLLARLRARDAENLRREVDADADARRRGPDVVDQSEGVPPVPIDLGGGGASF